MPKSRTTKRGRQERANRTHRQLRAAAYGKMARWLEEVADFRDRITPEEWAQIVDVGEDPRAATVQGELLLLAERVEIAKLAEDARDARTRGDLVRQALALFDGDQPHVPGPYSINAEDYKIGRTESP